MGGGRIGLAVLQSRARGCSAAHHAGLIGNTNAMVANQSAPASVPWRVETHRHDAHVAIG